MTCSPLRSAILTQVPKLIADTVPGFLAALEGLPNDIKAPMLEALASRPDILGLVNNAETDFTPYLWYYAGLPGDTAGELSEGRRQIGIGSRIDYGEYRLGLR